MDWFMLTAYGMTATVWAAFIWWALTSYSYFLTQGKATQGGILLSVGSMMALGPFMLAAGGILFASSGVKFLEYLYILTIVGGFLIYTLAPVGLVLFIIGLVRVISGSFKSE